MGAVFTRRVVAMKRSRTEVGRWRMLRQVNRRNDGFSCCYATTKQSSRLSEREMLRLACNDGRQDPEPSRLRRDRN